MNTATANLENDHVYILRLIDVMEQITLKPEANIEHLESIVNLIRNFADGLHHAKEENLLFPMMVEKGFSFQQGPVAVMMHEHVQGRNFVKGMSDNIPLYRGGDATALATIQANMKGYIELLRAHIGKEDNVLFRMADRALSEEEQISLIHEFRRIENHPESGIKAEGYISQIENLAQFYNV